MLQLGDYFSFAFRTPWSWVAFAASILLAAATAAPLSRWSGWERRGISLALFGAGLSLVPTLVARIGYFDFSPGFDPARACSTGVGTAWLTVEELLNTSLLIPLAVGLLWASRSLWVTAAAVVVWGSGIEILQAFTGLGACEQQDVLRYTTGALGTVVVIAALALAAAPERTAPERAAPTPARAPARTALTPARTPASAPARTPNPSPSPCPAALPKPGQTPLPRSAQPPPP